MPEPVRPVISLLWLSTNFLRTGKSQEQYDTTIATCFKNYKKRRKSYKNLSIYTACFNKNVISALSHLDLFSFPFSVCFQLKSALELP